MSPALLLQSVNEAAGRNTLLVAFIGLLGTGVTAYLTYRAATRVARQEALSSRAAATNETMRVTAEAYDKARGMYEAGITQVQEQLAREHATNSELLSEVTKLRNEVERLRRLLVENGISLVET